MSDPSKNLMEVYDDIDLCYKVLGLTFSDPPEQVDRVCQGLVEKYNRELQQPDQELRATAKNNLEQVHDLYERITNSMIYKDYAREYEKYKLLKADQHSEKKQQAAEKPPAMVRCPYCNKMISEKIKVCMYCHGKILTPMELVLHKVFRTRNMVAALIVVLLIVAGVMVLLHPELLRK